MRVAHQVAGHECQVREPTTVRRTARSTDHFVPGSVQGGDNMGTEEAVRAGDEDAHVGRDIIFHVFEKWRRHLVSHAACFSTNC
jgi:hypothetical protein